MERITKEGRIERKDLRKKYKNGRQKGRRIKITRKVRKKEKRKEGKEGNV